MKKPRIYPLKTFLGALLLIAGAGTLSGQTDSNYSEAGASLSVAAPMDADRAADFFASLQPADTLDAVFRARVVDVCQAKGCWMRLELPEGREVMVRFKDYGFFVPMDIAGREVVVGGKAFISEVSEAERRHLAEDAGLPEAEVMAITGPAREPGFVAEGVRIFN
ncbi:DUF4920 domain-containing protein [Robiginitalea sp. SC105]|uniref:DUF4920 domain-containing protein n=1 Tax=Robiginitalea sp. SC105 TaxID=2762332 RepID=UPI0016398BDB|nr:DUF4920 domain-containing protein [Robiginitalea sp. SC105]MBC2839897.1 DUF4920 domain-containing protein [Robiginitalea sp. SC105]